MLTVAVNLLSLIAVSTKTNCSTAKIINIIVLPVNSTLLLQVLARRSVQNQRG